MSEPALVQDHQRLTDAAIDMYKVLRCLVANMRAAGAEGGLVAAAEAALKKAKGES
jgi:hypothetical protein